MMRDSKTELTETLRETSDKYMNAITQIMELEENGVINL